MAPSTPWESRAANAAKLGEEAEKLLPAPILTTPGWQRYAQPAPRVDENARFAPPLAEPEPFSLFHRAGTISLFIFIPVVFSRINEFMGIPNVVLTTMLGCLVTSILTGSAYRSAVSRPGKLLLLLTLCMCLSVPFSLWRGGSFGLLTKDWLISLLVFFSIAGSVYTFDHCRKAMYAMALGGMLILLLTVRFGASAGGRFAFKWGTLGNPNDFATYLIMGLPFCLFILLNDSRGLFKLVSGFAVLGILVYGLKSGSRGAMVALVGIVGVLFFKLSIVNKMKLLIAGAVLLPVVLSIVPKETLQRLVTFGMATEEEREDNRQVSLASASYNARRRLIQDAIVVTLQHPLLGVGPGQFQVAASRMAEDRGIVSMWRETHNGYLQIASECGIPALILYLGLFVYCFRTNSALRKAAQAHPSLAPVGNMAMCLFMATAIFAFLSLFGSYGYTMLLPALCAFTLALQQTAQPVIRAALAAPAILPQDSVAPGIPRSQTAQLPPVRT